MSARKMCFDRVLPKNLMRPQQTIAHHGATRGIIVADKLWMNGSTLSVLFMEGTDKQKEHVKTQANWWTKHANLKFDFNDAPGADIRITFNEDDGAWSYVGTDAKQIPLTDATMNLGFLDGGTAAHEFGHAIGMAHEHQNPREGIEWNEAVVINDLAGPPNFWSEAEARLNVLRKYSFNQIRGTEFDPDSIMLYAYPDDWTVNSGGTKENHVLSEQDKAFIASSKAYPKMDQVIADSPILTVDAHAPYMTSIGMPGEEDVFQFTVTATGRHEIVTTGQTDVMMKLFGPDSQTQLIAEDDDGADGTNPRVVSYLAPGTYYVQVRHYNKKMGTGDYGILVTT